MQISEDQHRKMHQSVLNTLQKQNIKSRKHSSFHRPKEFHPIKKQSISMQIRKKSIIVQNSNRKAEQQMLISKQKKHYGSEYQSAQKHQQHVNRVINERSKGMHYRNHSFSINDKFPKQNNQYRRRNSINPGNHYLKNKYPGEYTQQNKIMMAFQNFCFSKQQKFLDSLRQVKTQIAIEVLQQVLNYAIDCKDVPKFLYIIKTMGDFYWVIGEGFMAVKYYNELRQAAILQKKYGVVASSLIFMAKCSMASGMYSQTIIILKKALEYSWYSKSDEVQLKVYDELGKAYYKMGDLSKARRYHNRFGSAICEDPKSPLKLLSHQKTAQLQARNIEQFYSEMIIVYLVQLSLPYKSLQQFPDLMGNQESIRSNIPKQPHHSIGNHSSLSTVQYKIQKIIKHWMFSEESEEPDFNPKQNNVQVSNDKGKNRKNWYIDFKMNQYLRTRGIKQLHKPQDVQETIQLRYKQTLQQKIQKKMKQPELPHNWYQSIVKRVVNDQKRKLNQINNQICIKKSYHETNKCKIQFFGNAFKRISSGSTGKIIQISHFLEEA